MKNGMIVGIGKAGNPDNMDNITPGMIVGSNTEVSDRTSPLQTIAIGIAQSIG